MTEVNFVNAEVLTVAPDEVLLIKLPGDVVDDVDVLISEMQELLKSVGLENRSFVLVGEFEWAKAKQDA